MYVIRSLATLEAYHTRISPQHHFTERLA